MLGFGSIAVTPLAAVPTVVFPSVTWIPLTTAISTVWIPL
jgi:hypothetical protein